MLIKNYKRTKCPFGCNLFNDESDYHYWEDKKVTSDEIHILDYIKNNFLHKKSKILHVGIGNSYIAKNINDYAWFKKNSEGQIKEGRQKRPNAFGLYDMHGNVAEWALDSYSPESYIAWGKGANNPVKKDKGLYPRVVRGGSYKDNKDKLRSASRGYSTRVWKQRDPQIPKSLWWHTDATHIGFRIVRPRKEPNKEELNKMWVRPKKEY